jgi:hypothetical protein
MWQTKFFKTLEQQEAWIAKNEHRYQIDIIIVNNGYAVEYRKLRKIL